MAETFPAEKNHYVVTQGSAFLGNASSELTPVGNNCYEARRVATPKRTLRWLSGDAVEQAKFCITPAGIVPSYYSSQRTGVGSERENFTLTFDFDAGMAKATGKRGQDRAITPGLLDKYSVEFGLRMWAREQRRAQTLNDGQQVSLAYGDRKSNRTYDFTVGVEEEVETPFGNVKARRFDAASRKGTTTFWLDAVNDFRLVKFERVKKGKAYTMVISPKGFKPKKKR